MPWCRSIHKRGKIKGPVRTMSKYVIDAYAWIEYFDGSVLGEKVKRIVEDTKNSIYTNVVTIAELAGHFKRKEFDFAETKKVLLSLSSIYLIDIEFAEEAGKLHVDLKKERKHMGLADVLILLTARKTDAKVVTGDEDFRGLKETVMIK